MPDRRGPRGKANRHSDPVWQQLYDAMERLYQEIEPGAQLCAVTVAVFNEGETTTTAYGVFPDKDPTHVRRYISTDPDGARTEAAWRQVAVDATPEEVV